MGKNLFDMISDIEEKKCRFETHEGAVRVEVVDHISYRHFDFSGTKIDYPMMICFDKQETDFVHISSLKTVRIVEQ